MFQNMQEKINHNNPVRKSDFLVTKSIMINDVAPFVRVRVNSKWTLLVSLMTSF